MNSSAIVPILLELLIKSAVIIVAASLLHRSLRRASAAKRHFVWAGAFGALLLLPLTKFVKPHWALFLEKHERAAVIHPGRIGELETVTEPLPAPPPATPAKAQFHLPGWRSMVIVVWIAGSAVVISYRLLGSIHLAMLKRRSTMINDRRFDDLMRTAVSEFSIKRPIASRYASDARVPVTWGILRPVLLFPQDWSRWNDERLLAALRHELAHIARNDYLVRRISQFVTALYWPNPLVWLASSSLRSSQEQACDDRVLQFGTPAEDYATLLFETAQVLANRDAGTRHALAMARPSTLESRVVAIVDDTRDRRPAGRFAVLGAIPFVAVSLGVSALAQLQNTPPPAKLPPGVEVPDATRRKAESIILPSIKFKKATLRECLDYLRRKSVELDPEKKGVNFVLKSSPDDPVADIKITMKLENVPLSEAVKYVAELSDVRFKYDQNAIAFVGRADSDVLIQREYKLPRELFLNETAGLRPDSALGAYANAIDFLKSKGITFPKHASAVYVASSGRLIIQNTQENLDLLDEILRELVGPQPATKSPAIGNSPAKGEVQPAIVATNTKLANSILPKLEFRGVTLTEAIPFLARKVQELDPEKTGVKFTLTPGAEKIENKITISLSRIPAGEALKYITNLANAKYWIAADGRVNIASEGELSLITKQYGVPANSVDPAAGTVRGPDGKVYSSAQEFFSAFGVKFPEGASAGLPVGSQSIAIRNTQENLDLADIIVAALVDAKGGTLSQAELDAFRKILADRK
jgi:beta-lactamase regulating signal transducer with metallopeptidase domain